MLIQLTNTDCSVCVWSCVPRCTETEGEPLCDCVSAPPGDIGDGFGDGVAERVAADLQHAARDEQEEQEDAAHHYHQVHPHALPET